MERSKALSIVPTLLSLSLCLTAHATNAAPKIRHSESSEAHASSKIPLVRKISPPDEEELEELRVPALYKIRGYETADLQARLYRNYGILAMNQTDEHSAVVLRNFLFLLNNGLPQETVQKLKGLRYLYAFKGHDRKYDLAAFHPEAKAISIGGILTYPETETAPFDPEILSTLAHELGHAFLLEYISPSELGALGEKFGGWTETKTAGASSLYAEAFFTPHPKAPRRGGRSLAEDPDYKRFNIVSQLATRNMHEWFADAFAAHVLAHLGQTGELGAEWREAIMQRPKNKRDLWVNYNNLSDEFSAWFRAKLGG